MGQTKLIMEVSGDALDQIDCGQLKRMPLAEKGSFDEYS